MGLGLSVQYHAYLLVVITHRIAGASSDGHSEAAGAAQRTHFWLKCVRAPER